MLLQFRSQSFEREIKMKRMYFVFFLIVLTVLLAISGCSGTDKEVPIIPTETSELADMPEPTYTSEPTETSESFVPTETEKPVEVVNDYTKTVENIVEGYNFSSLNPEQQSEIKKYELMGLDEFQALSQEEQAILGAWVVVNFKPHYDYMLEANKIDLHYTENPKTPEEILGNYAYLTSMCGAMVELNEDGNGAHIDVELGQKVIGAMRDTVTEDHLKSGADWVAQTQNTITVAEIDIKVITSKENSDGSIIMNTLWSSTDTVTMEGDGFSQKTFIPFSYTDIYGNSENMYLRSLGVGKDASEYVDIG